MILFDACRPFNWFRKLVFSLSTVLMLAAVLYKPEIFGLNFLAINNVTSILLLLVLLQFTYPLMWLVSFIFKKLRIIR